MKSVDALHIILTSAMALLVLLYTTDILKPMLPYILTFVIIIGIMVTAYAGYYIVERI